MSSIFYAWNLRYTWGSWLHCRNHHAETPNRLWQTFYFNIIKRNPNIWKHIWIVWLILKWLPWHLNQINGFQLGKLEWHNTGNVTRGLLGCKGHVAMTTGRQAPKQRQKKRRKKGGKRWLPRHVNYWRWCRRGVKSMAASGVLGPSYPAARVIASWQASCAAKQRNCVGVGEGNRASVLVSFPFFRMASVIFTLNWGDHLFFQPWRERPSFGAILLACF